MRSIKWSKQNQEFVPPYGTGATLYLRPLLIGVGENIGVAPAPEYLFIIFACRSDHISKASWPQRTFIVSDYDRAAPNGTGAAKVGGNYAASLLPGYEAHERNFSDCIYLDPETHTKIGGSGVR